MASTTDFSCFFLLLVLVPICSSFWSDYDEVERQKDSEIQSNNNYSNNAIGFGFIPFYEIFCKSEQFQCVSNYYQLIPGACVEPHLTCDSVPNWYFFVLFLLFPFSNIYLFIYLVFFQWQWVWRMVWQWSRSLQMKSWWILRKCRPLLLSIEWNNLSTSRTNKKKRIHPSVRNKCRKWGIDNERRQRAKWWRWRWWWWWWVS